MRLLAYAALVIGLVLSFGNQYNAAGVLMVIGVIGLFIARRGGAKPWQQCPKCLRPIRAGSAECPYCHADLSESGPSGEDK